MSTKLDPGAKAFVPGRTGFSLPPAETPPTNNDDGSQVEGSSHTQTPSHGPAAYPPPEDWSYYQQYQAQHEPAAYDGAGTDAGGTNYDENRSQLQSQIDYHLKMNQQAVAPVFIRVGKAEDQSKAETDHMRRVRENQQMQREEYRRSYPDRRESTARGAKPYTPEREPSISGSNVPPTTANGRQRWPKSKATGGAATAEAYARKLAAKQDVAQVKNGFEAFSNAVLHSVSPFMEPLRRRTGSSLPHIKVDQRYGKRGVPSSAVAQFIVAPVVPNYRPTHFDDLAPGDMMEFHADLAAVLRSIPSASAFCVSYGADWKQFGLPYAFLACREYAKEVLTLCPDETPNTRQDSSYEDDVVKDISDVVFGIKELAFLSEMSFVDAAEKRLNLYPLYDVFARLFVDIPNFQIQIRDLCNAPSTYLLKTSQSELHKAPYSGIKIAGNLSIWPQLPLYNLASGKRSFAPLHSGRDEGTSPQSPPETDSTATGPVDASFGSRSVSTSVPAAVAEPSATTNGCFSSVEGSPPSGVEKTAEKHRSPPKSPPTPTATPASASSNHLKGLLADAVVEHVRQGKFSPELVTPTSAEPARFGSGDSCMLSESSVVFGPNGTPPQSALRNSRSSDALAKPSLSVSFVDPSPDQLEKPKKATIDHKKQVKQRQRKAYVKRRNAVIVGVSAMVCVALGVLVFAKVRRQDN